MNIAEILMDHTAKQSGFETSRRYLSLSHAVKTCYAEKLANRFWGDRKFTDVQMHPERLNEPFQNLRKLIGKKVFVCDVSDLFHESVSKEFIGDVFYRMSLLSDTTFQILTKRPERAIEFYKYAEIKEKIKNIWIGVSCENQEQADKRIPLLLQIPAAVRFLSCEPLIGKVNLQKWMNYTYVNARQPTCLSFSNSGGSICQMVKVVHPNLGQI